MRFSNYSELKSYLDKTFLELDAEKSALNESKRYCWDLSTRIDQLQNEVSNSKDGSYSFDLQNQASFDEYKRLVDKNANNRHKMEELELQLKKKRRGLYDSAIIHDSKIRDVLRVIEEHKTLLSSVEELGTLKKSLGALAFSEQENVEKTFHPTSFLKSRTSSSYHSLLSASSLLSVSSFYDCSSVGSVNTTLASESDEYDDHHLLNSDLQPDSSLLRNAVSKRSRDAVSLYFKSAPPTTIYNDPKRVTRAFVPQFKKT